eukprot:3677804-Prymnesium_polylepis.1
MCSLDVALCAPSAATGAQRARVAHMHSCTHAARTCMGRAHGRTACTQGHHRWPISARARPGRHAASELAADVAVAETGAPAGVQRVDRCSSQID